METGYTERLCRIVTRCCGLWSYRLAKENLQEFFGISLSHTTLGKIAGHTADYGRTFHDLDDFFCTKGQEFLQEVFKQKLQERIEKNETTPEGKQCPHCKKKRRSKTRKKKR
jgi:hypothetical protein